MVELSQSTGFAGEPFSEGAIAADAGRQNLDGHKSVK
jgi:hypothetical protein